MWRRLWWWIDGFGRPIEMRRCDWIVGIDVLAVVVVVVSMMLLVAVVVDEVEVDSSQSCSMSCCCYFQ